MVVVSLGPGKFYGSSLPRPRFYVDVKYAEERIDPPVPVLEPLLSWANEAHWSMGGLSTSRFRLQGRIEGNVEKLREEMEKQSPVSHKFGLINLSMNPSLSPPPAPDLAGVKRKRYTDTLLIDEEDKGVEVSRKKTRRLVRKLGDAFDEVATEKDGEEGTVALRTRKSGSKKSRMTVESESESGSESDSGLVLREVKGEQKKRGVKKVSGSYVSVSVSPTSKRCSSRLLRKRSN